MDNDDMKNKIKEAEERGRLEMERIKNEEIERLEEIRRQKEEAERKIRERTTKLVNIFKGYIYKLILPGLFYKGVKEDMDK